MIPFVMETDLMQKYDFYQIMFMYFVFCNIGWIQESVIESIYHKKPVNRGFLKGPYIPIYGIGGMTMLFLCMPFKSNGFAVYFVGMLSCTVLEYFVGWLMETLFHKQFWDYSMMKFTYKNRISLLSSLFWGLLSLFMVYILYGIVDVAVSNIPHMFILVYDVIMGAAMIIDTILSISGQVAFSVRLKKLPSEKAKKLIMRNFVELGGMVAKRREQLRKFILRIEFDDEDREQTEIEPENESEELT